MLLLFIIGLLDSGARIMMMTQLTYNGQLSSEGIKGKVSYQVLPIHIHVGTPENQLISAVSRLTAYGVEYDKCIAYRYIAPRS